MEVFVELLKQINAAQILVILGGIWLFYSRLDAKIDKLDAKFEDKFDKLDAKFEDKFNKLDAKFEDKFDKLSEKVEDVDRRLCRIEGSLATHGHCLFNQAKAEQKAE